MTGTATLLQSELAVIKQALLDARERARRVADAAGADRWGVRPSAERWSVAECLIHLNTTTERFIPPLDDAVRELRKRGLTAVAPLHRDPIGWLLCWFLEPPYRIRTKTVPAFVPKAVEPMGEVLERFDYLQGELLMRLDRASGLALDRVKIASPFDARVKYNVFSAFSVIPVHQRRHLFQAEHVRAELTRT